MKLDSSDMEKIRRELTPHLVREMKGILNDAFADHSRFMHRNMPSTDPLPARHGAAWGKAEYDELKDCLRGFINVHANRNKRLPSAIAWKLKDMIKEFM